MTLYAYPDTRLFVPGTAELVGHENNKANRSPETGGIQAVSRPGARWGWVLDYTAHAKAEWRAVEAWWIRLSGMEHRLELWDLKNPRPRGSCNLGGVTLGAPVAQF